MGIFSRKTNDANLVLELLQQHATEGEEIEIYSDTFTPSGPIPDFWLTIHSLRPAKKVEVSLAPWQKVAGKELSNTILYVASFCKDVQVVRIGDAYFLLYTIKNRLGRTVYYLGGNPKQLKFADQNGAQDSWPNAPVTLKVFYEQVHNGFYSATTGVMGLTPLQGVRSLEQFGSNTALPFNPATTFNFFDNGMGDYVVIDFQKTSEDNAALFFSDEAPLHGINFWDVIDEWTVIGFEPS